MRMEITTTTIYWISRMDAISTTVGLISIVSGILSGMTFMIRLLDEADGIPLLDAKALRRLSAICATVSALMAAAFMFIPTTKDCAAMYVIPKIDNSQTVKELGPLAVEKAKQWLDGLAPDRKCGKDNEK